MPSRATMVRMGRKSSRGIARTDGHTTLWWHKAREGSVLMRSVVAVAVLLLDVPVAAPQDQVFGPEGILDDIQDRWMPYKAAHEREEQMRLKPEVTTDLPVWERCCGPCIELSQSRSCVGRRQHAHRADVALGHEMRRSAWTAAAVVQTRRLDSDGRTSASCNDGTAEANSTQSQGGVSAARGVDEQHRRLRQRRWRSRSAFSNPWITAWRSRSVVAVFTRCVSLPDGFAPQGLRTTRSTMNVVRPTATPAKANNGFGIPFLSTSFRPA